MKDMLGKKISVGSFVAFVGGTGNVSVLKIGLVKKLTENGVSLIAVERWYSRGDWGLVGQATGRPSTRLINVDQDRVMCLPKDLLSKDVLNILEP